MLTSIQASNLSNMPIGLSRKTMKFEFVSMTTRCVVQLSHTDELHIQEVAQQIYDNTKRLEQTYNFFSPNSWLTKQLNQRMGHTVRLSEEAWDIFNKVRKLSEQTTEVFDISVGTLRVPLALLPTKKSTGSEKTGIYNTDDSTTIECADERVLTVQTLYDNGATRQHVRQQYQQAIGLKAWSLNSQTQCLICHHPATRFDLGGVVKEYAVDAAIDIAARAGCEGLISFGGDVRVLGNKPSSDPNKSANPYKVGIKNPSNPQQTLLSVPLNNEALTTSGNYERYEQVGNQVLSHLIGEAMAEVQQEEQRQQCQQGQPHKGNSNNFTLSRSDTITSSWANIIPTSVTVISPSALTSGVFSTALMLKPNLALPTVDQCSGILKVILIDESSKLYAKANE